MAGGAPALEKAGRAQNQGMFFVKLKDWDLRDRAELRAQAIAGAAAPVLMGLREAVVVERQTVRR